MNAKQSLKTLVVIFFLFYASLCLAQGESSQLIDTLSRDSKIIEPELVLEDFVQGKATTRLIVNLSKPPSFQERADFKDLTFRKKSQEGVRAAQDRLIDRLDASKVRITNRFVYIFGFSAEVTLEGLKELTQIDEVVSINKDRTLKAHLAQGIPLINAATVRNMHNGSGVSIAICDTGIDYTHPRLGGGGFPNSKVIGGYDTGQDDTDPMDAAGHGTSCAGIAAGDLGTVGDYIGGVAHNARLYALKITYSTTGGSAYEADMIEAWEWCVTHQNDDPSNPIMVISTSFGGGYYTSSCDSASPAMTTAAANAVAAGLTLFVSSGNDGLCDGMSWPACITHVNAVGAVYDADIGGRYGWCIDYDSCIGSNAPGCDPYGDPWACDDPSTFADAVTCYSNSASFLSLFAPCNDAYTTDIAGSGGYSSGDYYDSFGGTSAACPYAAGSAACLQSAAESITGSFLTPAQVRLILANTGDLITDGKVSITKPRIDLAAAVNSLSGGAIYFYDNMEGPNNWLADPPWALIDTDAHSPTHSWTDSPGDYYENNVDVSLTVATSIDFSDAENPRLSFWHKYQIEPDYDYGYIEISTDGGSSWTILGTYSGFSGIESLLTTLPQHRDETGIPGPDADLWHETIGTLGTSEPWIREQFDITDYAGETNVLIRFRLETDKSIVMDGWYIDDVTIAEAPHPVTLHSPTNPTSTSLDLSWTQNLDPNFASYEIYRDTSPGVNLNSSLAATITDQEITNYTDTGLYPDTIYYYKVYVFNDFDLFTGSKEKSGTTLQSAIPFIWDFEAGQGDWVLDTPWAVSDEDSQSGTYCLTDSQGSNYGNNIDISAAVTLDLSDGVMPVLSFWHRYELENYADFGYVEVSTDNGVTWSRLYFATGSQADWHEVKIDLTSYAHLPQVMIRFRLTSNGSLTYDGWYIDDVRVEESTTAISYPFFDDMETEAGNWYASSWGLISPGHSGDNCFTDSPFGNYVWANYTALTLAGAIDLSGAQNPQLTFWHHYSIGRYDSAHVQIAYYDGQVWHWSTLATYGYGTQDNWQRVQLDLSSYAGQSQVKIRFCLYEDSYSGVGDGWYIDDVAIQEKPQDVTLNTPTNITRHSMDISWTEGPDDDFKQYELYRDITTGVDSSSTLVATITDKAQISYHDDGLLIGQTYYYKLYVLDQGDAYSDGSNEVVAATLNVEYPLMDDMESGTENWDAGPPWGLTDEDSHSGSFSWADSPGSNYGNNIDVSLRTSIDLSDGVMPVLSFWHRYELENYADFGYVEVSTDNGVTWSRLYFATGSQADWHEVKIDLTSYAHLPQVMIRFRLTSNGSLTYDGWYIDDVRVEESTTAISYPFFDDMETEAGNWYASSWGLISPGHSGDNCFTDSPFGNYVWANYTALTLAGAIDLSGAQNPQLTFWHHYSIGRYDSAHVQIAYYDGQVWHWSTLATYGYGTQDNWQRVQLDLSSYAGQSQVKIRFCLYEDSYSGMGDGWYIDDVRIDEDRECPINITIEPDTTTLLVGESQQFNVYDEFGVEITAGITWSIKGDIGTIDENGLFTAATMGIGSIVASVCVGETRDITTIIEVVCPAGGTSQIEQGNLYNSDSGTPGDDCIYFNAHITARPDEILTESSPGCGYGSGVWQVNVGNFSTGWSAGETLHIDFIDKCKGEKGTLDIVLTTSGQYTNLTLSAMSFELITTPTTNVNVVTLLKDSGITNAEELAQAIPNAIEIAYWSAEHQAYIGHTKGSPLINFDVYPGYPYFVTVTAADTWTPTGTVPEPWLIFSLITTGMTNVNMIGMPLDMLRITKAKELGHMILDATEIGRWDTVNQAYEFHTYGAPLFNFDVEPAYPYFVTVTGESEWMAEAGAAYAAMAGAPQNEGGNVFNSDSSVPEDGDITFEAYIVGREGEALTESSPGCGYGSGWWQVMVGNFPSGWDAGDILHIEFMNTANGEIGSLDVILEYGGQMNDVTLSPPPCEGDFDHDGDVDGSDLAVFAADFGRTDCTGSPDPCEGDFDDDGDVDGSDLAVFAADFGRTDCLP